ncbi:hypothetical protein Krac_7285 [Ktedonobacter racemifer DSM 44963]|uniref:Uncharacterized protein n=1 Tax=Ktedonobacter racemifer DSM 44963 TaxID=485913 RepID=D6TRR7_KTERA|nr:hypothetical protein Krac_7285 [Ktedonobacter racemifer DSM 44963]
MFKYPNSSRLRRSPGRWSDVCWQPAAASTHHLSLTHNFSGEGGVLLAGKSPSQLGPYKEDRTRIIRGRG